MINAQELRLGNYINDCTGGICTVRGYNSKGIYIRDKGGPGNSDMFSPVPITEQWLLDFGFTNEIEEELPEGAEFLCFFKDNIDIELQPALMGGQEVVGIVLYEDAIDKEGQLCSEGKYEIKTDIQYVHQLQNLFYCLVGEELTLKSS